MVSVGLNWRCSFVVNLGRKMMETVGSRVCGGSEERRALIDRGKVKVKEEEPQNGRMGVLGFKKH